MTGRHTSPIAFTLVEVLLALALTATVLTLVSRIAVQSLNLTRVVDEQIEVRRRQTYWADRMDRDIANAIDRGHLVTVDLDAHGRPRIEIIALTSVAEVNGAAAQLPSKVVYRVLTHEDRLRCVRESRSLLRGQSITNEETVGCGMESLEIEVWTDGAWKAAERIPDESRQPMPEAIRVRVSSSDAEGATARIWRLRNKPSRSRSRDR